VTPESRLRDGRASRDALVTVAAVAFLHDFIFGYVFLSSMNHYLLDVLHSGAGLPAFVIALSGLAAVAVQPLSGKHLDRFSPRSPLAATLLADVTGLTVILLVDNEFGFLGGSLLIAAGISAVWPLIFTLLRRTQPEGTRAASGLILTAAGIGGSSLGLATGVLASAHLHWQLTFILAFVPVVLSAIALFSPFLAGVHRSDSETEARPTVRHVALLGSLILVNSAAVSALLGLYGPFLRRTLGVSLGGGLALMLPAGLVALAILGVSTRYSRGSHRLIEIGFLFLLAGVGALLLASAPSPFIAALVAPLLFAGMATVEPVLNAAIIDAGTGDNAGQTFGALLSFRQAGVIAGPAAVGLVTQFSNPRWGLALTGLFLAIGASLALSARRLR
jgi:predicted MFS family arabinose efflux permease